MEYYSTKAGAIGIFDSGYGGLTVFDKIRELMPEYDYVYLGDNARAPYGSRSFDIVYRFTRQAVMKLFEQGCQLVILACNTASAKALRSIQQRDLPQWDATRRVLGVIRPTVECMDQLSQTKHVGIVGTCGTISSGSYQIELEKMFPHIHVTAKACPMWVPLVENGEFNSLGADYFVKRDLQQLFSQDKYIDTLILGCTHYPLLMNKIVQYVPKQVKVLAQGEYVAQSLSTYLKRHPEMDVKLTRTGKCRFFTTESASKFREIAAVFLSRPISVEEVSIDYVSSIQAAHPSDQSASKV